MNTQDRHEANDRLDDMAPEQPAPLPLAVARKCPHWQRIYDGPRSFDVAPIKAPKT